MYPSRDFSDDHVFTVRDMPHFAPYLQFLVNIIQIHFENVKHGYPDYNVSGAINKKDLNILDQYLSELQPGAHVVIKENAAKVLYASFAVVSRLLICDYGEKICNRLIRNLPQQHRWHQFEAFRNDLLHHNTQMLIDMDQNMSYLISGFDRMKQQLDKISL